ncbi:MAG: hypothetical protein Q4A10_06410 [Aerococcaceae bacterium]|nr:hypothetical protein [Aerococcaceae bacterium]
MTQFEIIERLPLPSIEQQTMLIYTKEYDEWYISTDIGKHARKWEKIVEPSEHSKNYKVYHSKTGNLIGIEGKITGNVILQSKKQLTAEQKQELKKRLERV